MTKFAIIQTGGKQYRVEEGKAIKVEKLEAEVGKPVVFDTVLLTYDEKQGVRLGSPYLQGISVAGMVKEQGKAKKIIVFKYKPKKRYRKKQGHRQRFTLVEITRIGEGNVEQKQKKRKPASKSKPKAKTKVRA